MSAIFDETIATQAELEKLCRRLRGSQLVDEHGRQLRVTISRTAEGPTPEMLVKFRTMCREIADQVGMDNGGGFINLSELVGKPHKRVSDKDIRRMFSAIAMRADLIPDPEGFGLIAFVESSKDLTKNQCSTAITVAESFGLARGVKFNDPKEVST